MNKQQQQINVEMNAHTCTHMYVKFTHLYTDAQTDKQMSEQNPKSHQYLCFSCAKKYRSILLKTPTGAALGPEEAHGGDGEAPLRRPETHRRQGLSLQDPRHVLRRGSEVAAWRLFGALEPTKKKEIDSTLTPGWPRLALHHF